MSGRLPLHDVHAQLGATFQEADGWAVPARYGETAREHEAVRERVGVIDRSERAKLDVTGRDRVSFLHGLVANDVKGLGPGQGSETALLDVHGKLTALLAIHCLEDRLVLEADRGLAATILAVIDRYLFSERVELEDVSDAWGLLTAAGPHARKALEAALGRALPDLGRRQHFGFPWEGSALRVVRTDEPGEESYDLWTDPTVLGRLWDRLRDAGAQPVGRAAWEILRVEAGGVRYGADVDATTLLLEAPLEHAYSLTKGCYLGQEVVARITYRGHVNRKIVGFRFADARVPSPGARVLVAGREVGRITSAAVSPASQAGLALGFLRREHWEPGTRVEVPEAGATLAAEVVALPFGRPTRDA